MIEGAAIFNAVLMLVYTPPYSQPDRAIYESVHYFQMLLYSLKYKKYDNILAHTFHT